jgi:hypothetical protein
MVETDVQAVALLALAFEWIRDGGFASRQQITAGAARDASTVSLKASRLDDPDIEYASALGDPTADTIGTVRLLAVNPGGFHDRAEALLHAMPNDPRSQLTGVDWAGPFLARWADVETAITELVDSGVTATLHPGA